MLLDFIKEVGIFVYKDRILKQQFSDCQRENNWDIIEGKFTLKFLYCK